MNWTIALWIVLVFCIGAELGFMLGKKHMLEVVKDLLRIENMKKRVDKK